jgi:hypothetical protein
MHALNLDFLGNWDFVHGTGDYAEHQACTMSAAVAAWRVSRGEDLGVATDRLECVDPVLRVLVIRRNDATPVGDLRSWALAMIPRIVGTHEGRERSVRRAAAVARHAIRVIAPLALDAAGLKAEAQRLRALGEAEPLIAYRGAALDVSRSSRVAAAAAADADADYAATIAAAAAIAADADADYAATIAAAAAIAADADADYAAAIAADADADYAATIAAADAAQHRIELVDGLIELAIAA